MTAFLLFISTFALVAALAAQSVFIIKQRYALAFVNSIAIGLMNLALFKFTPGASIAEATAFVAGGPFGVVASMWALRRLKHGEELSTAQRSGGESPRP
jgi:hypothetical protein